MADSLKLWEKRKRVRQHGKCIAGARRSGVAAVLHTAAVLAPAPAADSVAFHVATSPVVAATPAGAAAATAALAAVPVAVPAAVAVAAAVAAATPAPACVAAPASVSVAAHLKAWPFSAATRSANTLCQMYARPLHGCAFIRLRASSGGLARCMQ
eukprot:365357-Chlamydomonas_euryale.AAC.10